MRDLHRRQLLGGATMAAGGGLLPAWARAGAAAPGAVRDLPALSGPDIALSIDHAAWSVDGRTGHAVTVNGSLPAPLLRLKQGQTARIAVTVKNEPGALGAIATVIGAHKANILGLRMDNRDTTFHTNTIELEVRNASHLTRLLAALRAADAVSEAERV